MFHKLFGDQKLEDISFDFSKINFKEYFFNYKKYMNIIEYDDLIKIM